LDGVGQLLERLFVERGARLVGIGVEVVEGDFQHGVARSDGAAAGEKRRRGKLARRKQAGQPFVGWFALAHNVIGNQALGCQLSAVSMSN